MQIRVINDNIEKKNEKKMTIIQKLKIIVITVRIIMKI